MYHDQRDPSTRWIHIVIAFLWLFFSTFGLRTNYPDGVVIIEVMAIPTRLGYMGSYLDRVATHIQLLVPQLAA